MTCQPLWWDSEKAGWGIWQNWAVRQCQHSLAPTTEGLLQHLWPHSFSSVPTALGHWMQQCTRDPSRDEAASRSSWLKVVSRWHTQQVGSECSLCQGCQQHRDVHRNWGSVECKVEAGDLSESFVFSAGHPPSKRHKQILVAKSHYG